MKIIDEKFKRKQRKLEKEKEKEEEKKRELREAAKARPKPVYFPPLYYEVNNHSFNYILVIFVLNETDELVTCLCS